MKFSLFGNAFLRSLTNVTFSPRSIFVILESMTSQIDSKYVFPEDVRPQPLNNFTTQETCLPFSVEALISDKSPRIRPGNVDTTRKGCYSSKIRSPASNELPQRVVRDAPVKSQSLERGDCTPWMTRSEIPTSGTIIS